MDIYLHKKRKHVPLSHTVNQTGNQILWDVKINATTRIKHSRPNIGLKVPGEGKWQLIDLAILQEDHNKC